MLRALPLLLFLTLLSSACDPADEGSQTSASTEAVTTIYLVRHAEKGAGDDPDLTAEGTARADRLTGVLAGTELAAIYSTDTRRTLQTAAPTASARNLRPVTYAADDLAQLARKVKREHAGETVLVVGHSNTTPALANLLAGQDTERAFSESDYGNVLVVTVPPTGTARIERRRY